MRLLDVEVTNNVVKVCGMSRYAVEVYNAGLPDSGWHVLQSGGCAVELTGCEANPKRKVSYCEAYDWCKET